MDKNLRFYFYNLSARTDAPVSISDSLESQHAKKLIACRQIGIGSKLIRLERLEKYRGLLIGELIRKQTDNIPPKAGDEGLRALELGDGEGIGHSGVFCINEADGLMVLQYNRNAFSADTLMRYAQKSDVNCKWDADPVVTEDAWSRFEKGKPRSLAFKIAQPSDLKSVDIDDDLGFASNALKMKRAVEAPQIEVIMSMGRNPGFLQWRQVKQQINSLLNGRSSDAFDIEKLKVEVIDDDEKRDQISFFEELETNSRTLDLPPDPVLNYDERKKALLEVYDEYAERHSN